MQNKLEKNPQKSVQIKNSQEKIRIFSSAQLKYLAFISMLIDHVNKALIYPNLDGSAGLTNHQRSLSTSWGGSLSRYSCSFWWKGTSRPAADGNTCCILLGFGVISEVPFDLFTTSQVFEPNWNNIMFTLAAVLITIWSIDTLREKMDRLPKLLSVSGIRCDRGGDVLCSHEPGAGLRASRHPRSAISCTFFTSDTFCRSRSAFFPCTRSRGRCWDSR